MPEKVSSEPRFQRESTQRRREILQLLSGAIAPLSIATTGTARSREETSCSTAVRESPQRPGPSVLYTDPTPGPQRSPDEQFTAQPLGVCGQTAYVDGEFLSQGWPFDDTGPSVTESTSVEQPYGRTSGDLVYPTDTERYANNAADIVELRARPTSQGLAYRIALTSMVDPDAAIVAIGIDTGSASRTDWGHGLGDLGAGVDHVLTIWGTGAALDGEPLAADQYSVDVSSNQLQIEVALDPGRETWRHYAVAGIHDGGGGFAPVKPQPDERHPGGARSDEPPVLNVGFRTTEDEPLSSWHEQTQARALGERDLSDLGADIDFGRLRDGVTDRSVPRGGFFTRVYASRYQVGTGINADLDELSTSTLFSNLVPKIDNPFTERDESESPAGLFSSFIGADEQDGIEGDSAPKNVRFESQVQPYGVYVPESYDPETPTPVHVLLHSLGQNYNHYAVDTQLLEQFGEQRDSIVLLPHGRGPAGWWDGEAELDCFEAFADLRARYNVDLDRVTISGYSMGGYGTLKLASQYPDLFTRGVSMVGPPYAPFEANGIDSGIRGGLPLADVYLLSDNMRPVDVLLWNGLQDLLSPYPAVKAYRNQLAAHGYRHRLDTYPSFNHFEFYFRDEWADARRFLEDGTATTSPPRVTYRAVPGYDAPEYDLVHDGAYWVQDIEVAPEAEHGLVDAISLVDGYGEPVTEQQFDTEHEPDFHTETKLQWTGRTSERAPANALDVSLEDVTAATLHLDAAGIDPTLPIELQVESTTEATLTLRTQTTEWTVTVPSGESTQLVEECQ